MSSLPTGGFLTRKNGEAETGIPFFIFIFLHFCVLSQAGRCLSHGY